MEEPFEALVLIKPGVLSVGDSLAALATGLADLVWAAVSRASSLGSFDVLGGAGSQAGS